MKRPVTLAIDRVVLPASMRGQAPGFAAALEAALQRRLGAAPAPTEPPDPVAGKAADAVAGEVRRRDG